MHACMFGNVIPHKFVSTSQKHAELGIITPNSNFTRTATNHTEHSSCMLKKGYATKSPGKCRGIATNTKTF